MSSHSTLQDVTRKNVQTVAEMEFAAINSRTMGERFAGLVASWVGSWTFLLIQCSLLTVWIVVNLMGWWGIWDPYPFVLMNLILSVQAAFATPVILMSENRQGKITERRNHLDLQVNLLAEQENTELLRLLRLLCEKAGVRHDSAEVVAFEQPTDLNSITRQIVESVERGRP